MIGTPYYVSPELLLENGYSYKSDVWAIGCILYELCFLKKAFDGNKMIQIQNKILNSEPDFKNFRYS
jgi:NIMA (never in mitosis gene a)-related kinase